MRPSQVSQLILLASWSNFTFPLLEGTDLWLYQSANVYMNDLEGNLYAHCWANSLLFAYAWTNFLRLVHSSLCLGKHWKLMKSQNIVSLYFSPRCFSVTCTLKMNKNYLFKKANAAREKLSDKVPGKHLGRKHPLQILAVPSRLRSSRPARSLLETLPSLALIQEEQQPVMSEWTCTQYWQTAS